MTKVSGHDNQYYFIYSTASWIVDQEKHEQKIKSNPPPQVVKHVRAGFELVSLKV